MFLKFNFPVRIRQFIMNFFFILTKTYCIAQNPSAEMKKKVCAKINRQELQGSVALMVQQSCL